MQAADVENGSYRFPRYLHTDRKLKHQETAWGHCLHCLDRIYTLTLGRAKLPSEALHPACQLKGSAIAHAAGLSRRW